MFRMLRVAIIGLGPKGTFALERLLDHAAREDLGQRVEIDVFEPHPFPGAGPVYSPDQPGYLRMNVPAHAVDMWWPHNSTVPPQERLAFVTWRDRLREGADRDHYPARALVGRYLVAGLATMRRHAPPNVRVRLRPIEVTAVRPAASGWEVTGAAGSEGPYDEVLLATGHERSSDNGLSTDWPHAAALVPSVFPVERWLGSDHVPPQTTVAVRGFALSFIDAALALTEGRGGSFKALEDGHRLRYSPAAEEPAVILPFSRTGRPMLAKPDPGLFAAVPALDTIAEEGRGRILGLTDGIDLRRDVLPILTTAAQDALRSVGGRAGVEETGRLRTWLAGATDGRPAAPADPARAIERSVAVGTGAAPPDLLWALGHTWRTIYPALVRRLGADELSPTDWPAFRQLADEMERVSFGPPAANAAKLLALIDAGRVDLTLVHGARLTSTDGRTWLRSEQGERAVDVVIDAVLPGPGASGAHSALLQQLIGEGHARLTDGRRGLRVAADAGCTDENERSSAGLSAIGRPTEDAVIGNDTLSRTLHPLADLWARSVLRRAGQSKVPSINGACHAALAAE